MTNTRRTLDMTTGPVLQRLMTFVIPILLSNLLQHFYTAADKIVVGQFAGKLALAAVGAAGQPITLLTTLLSSVSLGSTIVCSNLRGAKKQDELYRTMHSVVVLSFCIGMFLSVFGMICTEPILRLMSCPENVLPKAALYMRITFCGTPLSMVYNFSAGMLRAHGDAKRPMLILSFTGLVNVCLNLVFVLVFKMDVDGVALATITARILSAIIILRILFDPKDVYKLQWKKLRMDKHDAVKILKVGLPCGINGLVFSFSNTMIQSTVNTFGDTILAGNVAAGGIVDLVYQVLIAFYSGCISFSGQCFGAKKYRRLDKLLIQSILACEGILLVINLIATAFPEAILSLFNQDPEVIAAGIPKLQMLGWSYMLYAISEVLLGCLRGIGKTSVPSFMNIFCICIPRLTWIFIIFPLLPRNLYMLYICYPLSYVINITVLGIYYIKCRKALALRGDEILEEATA